MSLRNRILFLLAFIAAVPVGFGLVTLFRRRKDQGSRPSMRTEMGLIELPRSRRPVDTPSTPAGVTISALQYATDDEYVAVYNGGASEVSVEGWRLTSTSGGQQFTFPEGAVIEPGATLRVHSGPEVASLSTTGDDLLWSHTYVWNNKGDEARLEDADGNLVDRWRY